MTRRDKLGAVGLILLFVCFILALIWTTEPSGPAHDPGDSFFVQQRIKNLEKSR